MQLFTEASIAVLMLGTIIGAMIQCGEVGAAGLEWTWPDTTPGFLTYRGGMVIVIFFTVAVILPLSMLRSMRKLETVGAFGTLVVWFLMFAVIVYACQHGLPALKDGTFAPVNQGSVSDVANAFSLFGFAFYLQAIMMPLLAEMPPGRTGARITNAASNITVLGVALITYVVTGFFGAAMYGYSGTSDNILNNQWFGSTVTGADGQVVSISGTAGQFVLNLLMTIYLAISLPPIVYACCLPFHSWLVTLTRGRFEELGFMTRKLIVNVIVITICLAVSLAAPDQSGNVLTVTGATGVCLVSYVIPVVSHLMMFFGWAHFQREQQHPPLDDKLSRDLSDDAADKLSPDFSGDAADATKDASDGAGEDDVTKTFVTHGEDSATVPGPRTLRVRHSMQAAELPGTTERDELQPPHSPTAGQAARESAIHAGIHLNRDSMDQQTLHDNMLIAPHGLFPGATAVTEELPPRLPASPAAPSSCIARSWTRFARFQVHPVYHPHHWPWALMVLWEVVVPLAVLALGVLFSVSTLVLLHNSISSGSG